MRIGDKVYQYQLSSDGVFRTFEFEVVNVKKNPSTHYLCKCSVDEKLATHQFYENEFDVLNTCCGTYFVVSADSNPNNAKNMIVDALVKEKEHENKSYENKIKQLSKLISVLGNERPDILQKEPDELEY